MKNHNTSRTVKWLHGGFKKDSSISWGMPWAQGTLNPSQSVLVHDHAGTPITVDTWPMAYWPDGSVKWSGHAGRFQAGSEAYQVSVGSSVAESVKSAKQTIKVTSNKQHITIDTGVIQCVLNTSGSTCIESLKQSQQELCHGGNLLVVVRQKEADGVFRDIEYQGYIEKTTIEHQSAQKCTINMEGRHRKGGCGQGGSVEIIPFHLRFTFYAHESSIKIVHTFFYDADKKNDMIYRMGIRFASNFTGDPINRKVGYALDTGMYLEGAQHLISRPYRDNNSDYQRQLAGEVIDIQALDSELLEWARGNAVWNNYSLHQDSAKHCVLQKSTSHNLAAVDVLHGEKQQGMLYACCDTHGMSATLKHAWQKYPSTLELSGLTEQETQFGVWFWDGKEMDMRHYSDTHHMAVYEGFEEVRSDPVGIANTSELYLNVYTVAPTLDQLFQESLHYQQENLLVCESGDYYQTQACGFWTPRKNLESLKGTEKQLEEELERNFSFYQQEVDQRQWYGFWNYGDVMHSYDRYRHQWMYDLGGYAWQNTELMPNIWLWYSFFRTTSADIFEFARAMTRHNSEVDCYHLGPYKGLGSRHNVIHWGCSCKEARIAMSILYKYFYYLTCDERTGEILEESLAVTDSLKILEPLRGFYPEEPNELHIRTGPDWSAYCANWLTAWERTGDTAYRDKIVRGIDFLKTQPLRLLTGPAIRYNPDTNTMEALEDGTRRGSYHMAICFGAPQIWAEIGELLADNIWKDMLAEFGDYYGMSEEERVTASQGRIDPKSFHWPEFGTPMMAYAAWFRSNPKRAQHAWEILLGQLSNVGHLIDAKPRESWCTLFEDPKITTNCVAQWSLNVIWSLYFIQKYLPQEK